MTYQQPRFYEKDLEDFIVDNVDDFIQKIFKPEELEMITFLGRQIKIGTKITDLLFLREIDMPNSPRGLIIVELKANALNPQHVNQLMEYISLAETKMYELDVDYVEGWLIGTEASISLHYRGVDEIYFAEIKHSFEYITANYSFADSFVKELDVSEIKEKLDNLKGD